ncbi:hypothetical protein E6Q11_05595 [Candidatus Dojkabacteria bacterium]|uniref:Uncharacterized protein n=1 Tax=Candidatus Dojkabacteria bacterium TaxID=2099670 RepID=A0A5C7J657_9BACT|nr:MAG: hypothetical protein E6Q11_05595 [Candidatus Dojkabacteria bacterium]
MAIRRSIGLLDRLTYNAGYGRIFEHGRIYLYDGQQPTSPDHGVSISPLAVVCQGGITPIPGSSVGGLEFNFPGGGVLSDYPQWVAKGMRTGRVTWWRMFWYLPDPNTDSQEYPRMDGGINDSLFMLDRDIVAGTNYNVESFTMRV